MILRILHTNPVKFSKKQLILCANLPGFSARGRSAQRRALQQQWITGLNKAGFPHGIDSAFIVIAKTIKANRVMLGINS